MVIINLKQINGDLKLRQFSRESVALNVAN